MTPATIARSSVRRIASLTLCAACAVAISMRAPAARGLAQGDDVQTHGGIRVRRVAPTPDPPNVQLRIRQPADGAMLHPSEEPTVSIDLSGFPLGQPTDNPRAQEILNNPMGQHVHLILDNEPYQPVSDVSRPVKLKRVPAGAHTLRAFPAFSYHESVKSPGAYDMVSFHVSTRGLALVGRSQPLLTYSRPTGDYAGAQAEKILLDFYLSNATLGRNQYHVRLSIDGNEFMLYDWSPYYIESLRPGRHTIKLDLLDSRGRNASGSYNSTTRTINVRS